MAEFITALLVDIVRALKEGLLELAFLLFCLLLYLVYAGLVWVWQAAVRLYKYLRGRVDPAFREREEERQRHEDQQRAQWAWTGRQAEARTSRRRGSRRSARGETTRDRSGRGPSGSSDDSPRTTRRERSDDWSYRTGGRIGGDREGFSTGGSIGSDDSRSAFVTGGTMEDSDWEEDSKAEREDEDSSEKLEEGSSESGDGDEPKAEKD